MNPLAFLSLNDLGRLITIITDNVSNYTELGKIVCILVENTKFSLLNGDVKDENY